jgi:hypothetical protein
VIRFLTVIGNTCEHPGMLCLDSRDRPFGRRDANSMAFPVCMYHSVYVYMFACVGVRKCTTVFKLPGAGVTDILVSDMVCQGNTFACA